MTSQKVADPELADLANRLHRVAGQILGIERMLAGGRPCADLLMQLAAADGALHAIAQRVFARNVHQAAGQISSGAITAGDAARQMIHLAALLSRPGPRPTKSRSAAEQQHPAWAMLSRYGQRPTPGCM